MKNQYDFIGDCPAIVSNRIDETLNNLPTRKRPIISLNIVNIASASIAAALLLFIITWTINPVMAQGNTFRDMLMQMLSQQPEAQEIIEAPLPAEKIEEAIDNKVPEETAALISSDEQDVKIPAVVVDGYEFRLDDQIIYDGAQLTVAFNVRKADGSPMPSKEEFTKHHMAGFIRIRELMMGDTKLQSTGELIFDWDDPYIYRQIMTYNMRNVSSQVTDDTEFVLSVGIYHYGEPNGTIEHFAYLPFCVDTSHSDFAKSYELEQSMFDTGEFIVEVMPIMDSVTGMQIEIRVYKTDDAGWGKRVNESMFVNIQKLDGTPIPFLTGSFGFNTTEDGITYIETIYELSAREQLPKQLRIYFTCGDANPGEDIDYEPIIITFK